MCGLVGVINKEVSNYHKLNDIFYQMLYADALRGNHGTGITVVKNNLKPTVFKKGVSSNDFLNHSLTKELIKDKSHLFIGGHNRFATQGEHTDNNAHPFKHGHIVLFHNGTLQNYKGLSTESFDVDSEYIAQGMSLQQTSNSVVKFLEQLEGAYALVWYNNFNKTINFARNKERPLYVASLKYGNSIIYASEKGLIEWIAERNKVHINEPKSLIAGSWLSLSLKSKDLTSEVRKFKPKEDYLYYPFVQNNSIHKRFNISKGTIGNISSTKITKEENTLLNMTKTSLVKFYMFEPYLNEIDRTPSNIGRLYGKSLDELITFVVLGITRNEALKHYEATCLVEITNKQIKDPYPCKIVRHATYGEVATEIKLIKDITKQAVLDSSDENNKSFSNDNTDTCVYCNTVVNKNSKYSISNVTACRECFNSILQTDSLN